VREVVARSALQPTALSGMDYTLNPYRGCENGCLYCYAPSILREERPWGTFVDVRRNMPQVLAREIKRRQKGIVGISTVTDPYQPVEKELEVTRHCLEVLLRKNWPVSVQTKSTLVGRDINILKFFTKADVGMTITSVDDDIRRMYEPGTPPAEEQFQVLDGLREAGIYTWVYVAPMVPFVTEDSIDRIVLEARRAGVRKVMFDGLRARGRSWEAMEGFIRSWRPELTDDFKKLKSHGQEHFMGVAKRFEQACDRVDMRGEVVVGRDDL
jgi:DNA repair photolyase